MNNIKNWIIAVLSIVCIALCWSNKHKEAQIKTIEEASTEQLLKYVDIVVAGERVLDEVCFYIEDKYNEYLPDTIWEGDTYDEYVTAFEQLRNAY